MYKIIKYKNVNIRETCLRNFSLVLWLLYNTFCVSKWNVSLLLKDDIYGSIFVIVLRWEGLEKFQEQLSKDFSSRPRSRIILDHRMNIQRVLESGFKRTSDYLTRGLHRNSNTTKTSCEQLDTFGYSQVFHTKVSSLSDFARLE